MSERKNKYSSPNPEDWYIKPEDVVFELPADTVVVAWVTKSENPGSMVNVGFLHNDRVHPYASVHGGIDGYLSWGIEEVRVLAVYELAGKPVEV